MHSNLFSDGIIDKSVFEKSVWVSVGCDLKLPQSVALVQCRNYSSRLYQMWSDGFSIEYTLECLIDWIMGSAKDDDDLYWHLHKRCRETEELFEFE